MSSGSSPSIQEHERDEAGYTLTPTLILGQNLQLMTQQRPNLNDWRLSLNSEAAKTR
jgi:hypothetical protein